MEALGTDTGLALQHAAAMAPMKRFCWLPLLATLALARDPENLLADVKKLNNCEGDFPNMLQDYQLTVGDDVRKVYATGKINFTQPFGAGTWYRKTSSLCLENYNIDSCSRYYAWHSIFCDPLKNAPDLWQQLMKGTPDMPKACPIPAGVYYMDHAWVDLEALRYLYKRPGYFVLKIQFYTGEKELMCLTTLTNIRSNRKKKKPQSYSA